MLPLLRKDGQPELAREVYESLRRRMQAEYDDGGTIGKRYRRHDEIGTPWCVTVDHQSATDGTVTVRDRDTLDQQRFADRRARAAELERRLSSPTGAPRSSLQTRITGRLRRRARLWLGCDERIHPAHPRSGRVVLIAVLITLSIAGAFSGSSAVPTTRRGR